MYIFNALSKFSLDPRATKLSVWEKYHVDTHAYYVLLPDCLRTSWAFYLIDGSVKSTGHHETLGSIYDHWWWFKNVWNYRQFWVRWDRSMYNHIVLSHWRLVLACLRLHSWQVFLKLWSWASDKHYSKQLLN